MNSPLSNASEVLPPEGDDRLRLVGAIGTVLAQTVGTLESTVSRITELTVLKQKGSAGSDLVVALQEFDRLQQEFATLAQLLERLHIGDASAPRLAPAELLSAVTIAALKNRLSAALIDPLEDDLSPQPEDREF
jgi:hypothetical protein